MTNNGDKSKKNMSVLLIDDDPAMRSLVCDELRDEGFHVVSVADGREALNSLNQLSPALIITDLRMPHGGMALIAKFKAAFPLAPVILITAFGDKDTESLAYEQGVSAYFNKPVRMGELKEAVHNLLDRSESKGKEATL